MTFDNLADLQQISMAEESEEYKEFTEKFKPKHTTDDCWTPDNIYAAVKNWAMKRYGLPEDVQVIRPFMPGGDYQAESYPEGCVVIDNPPFSILAKIVAWYQAHGVKFFLFANGLTCGNIAWKWEGVTAVTAGITLTYDNGAGVNTNFLTNMSPDLLTESAPDLHDTLKEINEQNKKKQKKQVTKLALPNEIVTAARMNYLAIHGIHWSVKRGAGVFTSKLDNYKKGVFGGGLLLNEETAAERAAAERAAAERVQLSEREKEIVKSLGRNRA